MAYCIIGMVDNVTQTFTARETVTIYHGMDNTRNPFPVRMQAGETGIVLEDRGLWLYVQAKSVLGYVERKRVTISGATPPPVPTPDLVWIKGYWDVFGVDYVTNRYGESLPNLYGLPAAIKLYTTKQINISPDTDTRRLWFEEFRKRAPLNITNINSRFTGLLKNGVCYSDGAGNKGFNQIITACNVAYSMGNPETKAGNPGKLFRPIRMLKVASYANMKAQVEKYPYLLHNATVSTRGQDGREVIPFWHLMGHDVKVPNFCADEVNWIPEEFIEPYVGQSSYYPIRERIAV